MREQEGNRIEVANGAQMQYCGGSSLSSVCSSTLSNDDK